MTNPRLAVATDKGRYYADPHGGPSLISVTNVLDAAVAKPVLVPWAAKVVAERALEILPEVVARSRTDREQLLKDLKGHTKVVRETAAGLGSRVHAAAEAHLLGHQRIDDPDVEPFLAQYETWLSAWDIDIAHHVHSAEVTVANRRIGYAGTLDLLVELPLWPALDGKPAQRTTGGERHLWMVDTKTSSTQPASRVYPEYALQQVAYRHAEVMWLPDGSEAPMPKVAGVAVLNLRKASHALIPLPAGMAEWTAFQSALRTALWMHAWPAGAEGPQPVEAHSATPKPKRANRQTKTTTTTNEAA